VDLTDLAENDVGNLGISRGQIRAGIDCIGIYGGVTRTSLMERYETVDRERQKRLQARRRMIIKTSDI